MEWNDSPGECPSTLVPFCQAMRGLGTPDALHSSLTSSPLMTRLFHEPSIAIVGGTAQICYVGVRQRHTERERQAD